MKKLLSLFLIACLCTVLLCACTEQPAPPPPGTENVPITDADRSEDSTPAQSSQNTDTPPIVTQADTETENGEKTPDIVSGAEILRFPYDDGILFEQLGAAASSQDTSVIRLQTEEEFRAFLEKTEAFIQERGGYGYDFDASRLSSVYDKAFFAERSRLVFQLSAESGSIRYRNPGISYDESTGTLTVTVEKRIPAAGTCDMASWLLLVPLEADMAEAENILLSMLVTRESEDISEPTSIQSDAESVYITRISYVDHEEVLNNTPYETISANTGTAFSLMRFSRWEEFSAWKEENLLPYESAKGYGQDGQAMKAAAVFDETFFEENALFVLLWSESSGSYSHEFRSVTCDKAGEVTVVVQTTRPQLHTADMATWILFLPIKSEYADTEPVNILISIQNTK